MFSGGTTASATIVVSGQSYVLHFFITNILLWQSLQRSCQVCTAVKNLLWDVSAFKWCNCDIGSKGSQGIGTIGGILSSFISWKGTLWHFITLHVQWSQSRGHFTALSSLEWNPRGHFMKLCSQKRHPTGQFIIICPMVYSALESTLLHVPT